jgi:hypothetical protein
MKVPAPVYRHEPRLPLRPFGWSPVQFCLIASTTSALVVATGKLGVYRRSKENSARLSLAYGATKTQTRKTDRGQDRPRKRAIWLFR